MNRTVQSISIGIMTISMAGFVGAVSPQLLTVEAPTTDTSIPNNSQVVSVANAPTDLVDAYRWRMTAVSPPTTVPPTPNPGGF
jgi:hypothetical protein